MKKTTSQNGFTLIELIIVMVILGIMAAVAVPRYLDSIANAEESAENAVISSIRSGLKQAANDSLYTHGRPSWPTNPFEVLAENQLAIQLTTLLLMRMASGHSSLMETQPRSLTREMITAATPGPILREHRIKLMVMLLALVHSSIEIQCRT